MVFTRVEKTLKLNKNFLLKLCFWLGVKNEDL
jgi:hypothetical protein